MRDEYKSMCTACRQGNWTDAASDHERCGRCGQMARRPIDWSDLDPRFTPFYGTDTRIGVVWRSDPKVAEEDERVEYGRVSRTTGWRPSYLLMHRSSDVGSSTLLNQSMVIVKIKRGSRYVDY